MGEPRFADGARADVGRAKESLRHEIWERLDAHHAVPASSARDRVPTFVGALEAADLLTTTDEWRRARSVLANPDKAQLPVRAAALRAGKTVYLALPELDTEAPFHRLDPAELTIPVEDAASMRTATLFSPAVGLADLPVIDLVVCGSVAVNRAGARLGKGTGFADIELALLADAGRISAETTIATTVHPLQVVDGPLPETEHDVRVDLVVTPEEVVACHPPARTPRIFWDRLTPAMFASMPLLAARRPQP